MKKNIKNRGFTHTPILASLHSFFDIFSKKFRFLFNKEYRELNKCCNKKTMPKLVSGFMAVEILVASSIIAISILSATAVAQKSIYVSRQAFHATQAAFLLEEGAENTRIARDNAWNNVISLNSSEQIGIFTRTVVSSSVCRNTNDPNKDDISFCGGSTSPDVGTKLITVSVSWTEGGVTVTKNLKFYITNIFS